MLRAWLNKHGHCENGLELHILWPIWVANRGGPVTLNDSPSQVLFGHCSLVFGQRMSLWKMHKTRDNVYLSLLAVLVGAKVLSSGQGGVSDTLYRLI